MSYELVPLDNKKALAAAFAMFDDVADDEFDTGAKVGFPVISIKGKTFAVIRGEERTIVHKPGTENDEDGPVPARILDVVVLRSMPGMSKTYYKGKFVEGSTESPNCYSNDGITPAADATEPQARTCASCKHNIWGSRISEEGKKGKACVDVKRLAVAPAGQLNDPMLIRVPAASLKAWTQYVDALKKRGLKPPMVVTAIGFDNEVAYPSLIFKPRPGVLPPEALKEVQEVRQSTIVESILGAVKHEAEVTADENAAPVEYAKRAPVVEESEEEEEEEVAPPPKTTKKAKAAPVMEDDDDDVVVAAPAKTVKKPKAEPKAEPAKAVDMGDDLLGLSDMIAGLSFSNEE
jgi:hypothetical protein